MEGRQEGQDEMATLSEKLILADRISELLKASTNREYRNKLLVEFGLANSAGDHSQFSDQCDYMISVRREAAAGLGVNR